MNFIQDIQEKEKETTEILIRAEKKTSEMLRSEQKRQNDDILKLKTKLKEEQLKEKDAQKMELTKLYKKIIKNGVSKAEQIKEDSNKKQSEAINFILKNLLKK